MKREIKFRGKNPKDGKWYYGSLVLDYDKKPMILVAGYSHTGSAFSGCLNVIPETVGQFTGLKDSNGKDIYEGDIVSGYNCRDFCINKNGFINAAITWIQAKCSFGLQVKDISKSYLCSLTSDITTIIGNIYDNPELLKGGAE